MLQHVRPKSISSNVLPADWDAEGLGCETMKEDVQDNVASDARPLQQGGVEKLKLSN